MPNLHLFKEINGRGASTTDGGEMTDNLETRKRISREVTCRVLLRGDESQKADLKPKRCW